MADLSIAKVRAQHGGDDLAQADPADRLVAADWIGDGSDTVGIFRPDDATFYLRYANTSGIADEVIPFGAPAWLPVAGAT